MLAEIDMQFGEHALHSLYLAIDRGLHVFDRRILLRFDAVERLRHPLELRIQAARRVLRATLMLARLRLVVVVIDWCRLRCSPCRSPGCALDSREVAAKRRAALFERR